MNTNLNSDHLGLFPDRVNVLVSYHYWNNKLQNSKLWSSGKVNLFIDSGAYSNFTNLQKGKAPSVELDDYCNWVKDNRSILWKYINLDVIGDDKGSEYNFNLMKSRGLSPVPVFTKSSTMTSDQRKTALLKMVKENDFLCLGGVAHGLTKKENLNYVLGCANFLHKQNANFHLLGCGSPRVLKVVKPYSSDSSSYTSGNKFGALNLFFNGKFYAVDSETIKNKKKVPTYVLSKYLMNDRHRNSNSLWDIKGYHFRYVRNIMSYIFFQRYVRKKFGTNYFIALHPSQLDDFEQAVSYGI